MAIPVSLPKIQPGQHHLTPEQEAYARQFAQEHIAAMLSTAEISEREAEQHLQAAYRVAGIEPPPTVRWFDSPIPFVGDSVWASVRASVWASVRDSVGDSVRASVGASVGDSVRASVGDSVRASVRASVGDSVGDSVWASVRASVWDSVRASVGASVWDSVRDSVWDSVWAYYNEHWLAFYHFFHEVFVANDLVHFALFNEMVSGYRLGRTEAWLVRKPVVLERDEQGRLHSPSGMCLKYRDGWGFYAWHGVRVSEHIILRPETLSRQDWMQEDNLEVRRVIQERLQERLGERFIEEMGATLLNSGRYGDLYEVTIFPDPERIARYVRVRDSSTERIYFLRVPPAISQADEGVAWTFGLEMSAYRPLQEA